MGVPMTYDQWRADDQPSEPEPTFTYDAALDDEICDHCGKPQGADEPGCVACRRLNEIPLHKTLT